MSNNEARRRVIGKNGTLVDRVVNLYRLKWLVHVLSTPDHYLARFTMLADIRVGWKKITKAQTKM